ncbi:McrB family protein [Clostridium felsineum]|uniref:McrB family protein n=1 Tax=Clostridium felsineum TaxID=36839 RepID=UPI0009D5BB73|nr:AAA family ATPase [Clostridium felsineum]URZ00278.1 hypothetical protein CLAUR_002660 [Clostridium felsineum]
MAYKAKEASITLFGYLNISEQSVKFIEKTNKRGFIYNTTNEEQCVIFIYPISHKSDDSKSFFDTRDSGAFEREITWNYALQNKIKYFCFAVHDQVTRYNDYIFSLECNEKTVEEVSGTKGGVRSGSGTQVVIPNDYVPHKAFERILTKNGFFISVIHKKCIFDYIEKYDNRPYLLDDKLIELSSVEHSFQPENDFDKVGRVFGGTNILLYGVPGSGKSWTIQHEYCDDENCMERLVFHPDYTYSDFIGQILPSVDADGKVSYAFKPGPFTVLLREAYTHPDKEYFLVIEEINRGNSPAIFGDVFQLLDRKMMIRERNDDGYPIGTSEYAISNVDIAKIVYNDPKHKVRIPSNMSIIGTMNTSDQNVFTLDTAFQRRWNMRLIENSFESVETEFANQKILDTTITWRVFCTAINEIILDKNVRMTSSEDKRLGTYFVHLQELIYDNDADNTNLDEFTRAKANRNNRRFPEKVIKYLWDDAFKFSREEIFEVDKYNSLETIIRKFMQEKGNSRFSIFKQSVFDAFIIDSNEKK